MVHSNCNTTHKQKQYNYNIRKILCIANSMFYNCLFLIYTQYKIESCPLENCRGKCVITLYGSQFEISSLC